jgi:hypothetical protein
VRKTSGESESKCNAPGFGKLATQFFVFAQKGDQVWGTYTSTSGNNTAVFRRVSR